MDSEQVPALREVDEKQFLERFNRASASVFRAQFDDSDDRWAEAAEQICGLLSFAINEEPLWIGLHEAVEGVTGVRDEIRLVQERFSDFLAAEYLLLTRRGLSSNAASQIVNSVKSGLLSFDNPTHEDIDESRIELNTLANSLCTGVEDWSTFADPERKARREVNTIAVLGGTGAFLATASNAIAVILPPFVAGSIVGGLAGGVAALLGFRRRGGRR